MSEPDSNAEADVPVTRWSRRAVEGTTPDVESTVSPSPSTAGGSSDQFASLAERAARLAPPKTVSVRRIDEVFPEPRTLETSDLPKLTDPNADTPDVSESAAGDAGEPWPSFSAAQPLPPTPVLPTTSIDVEELESLSLDSESLSLDSESLSLDSESLSLDGESLSLDGEADSGRAAGDDVAEETVGSGADDTSDTLELRREEPPSPDPDDTSDTLELRREEPPSPDPDVPPPTQNLHLTVAPIQHAMLPAVAEPEPEPERNRTGLALLAMATALAVLSGVLGALWLRERSASADLRTQLTEVSATDEVTEQGLESLNDEVRTLRLQNDQLQQQLSDMSALVLELPEGRVTEIAVPFTPLFADEENGRLIAIGDGGEYITWGEGADGPITDSGNVSGTPTGLFAATRKAWVSTEAGRIDVLSLVAGEPGLASVEFGPTSFMAAEERGYWTYNSASSEVVRLKKSDGGITDSVSVPVPVIDLTIGAGSVWALGDDGRVYRVNTADLTVQAIDAGEDLIAVTAGPDALWTLSAADGSLRRVDPVTGEVLVTVPVGRDPIDATFAGSSVWVALRSGSSLIEVDTRTSAVVSRTTLPSEPTALHQGDSGVFVTTAGEVPLLRVASLTPVEPEPVEDAEADGS